jgi:hypothetical protein
MVNDNLSELRQSVRESQKLSKVDMLKLNQFILQILNHRDILNSFVKDQITSIESFEYLILPKYTIEMGLKDADLPSLRNSCLRTSAQAATNLASPRQQQSLAIAQQLAINTFLEKNNIDVHQANQQQFVQLSYQSEFFA